MLEVFNYAVNAAKPFCRVEARDNAFRLHFCENDAAEINLTVSAEAARRLFRAYEVARDSGGCAFVSERGKVFRHTEGDKSPVQLAA